MRRNAWSFRSDKVLEKADDDDDSWEGKVLFSVIVEMAVKWKEISVL